MSINWPYRFDTLDALYRIAAPVHVSPRSLHVPCLLLPCSSPPPPPPPPRPMQLTAPSHTSSSRSRTPSSVKGSDGLSTTSTTLRQVSDSSAGGKRVLRYNMW